MTDLQQAVLDESLEYVAAAPALAYIAGATSPDSPLLKRAIELLDEAVAIINEGHARSSWFIEEGLKEIRECQEAMR